VKSAPPEARTIHVVAAKTGGTRIIDMNKNRQIGITISFDFLNLIFSRAFPLFSRINDMLIKAFRCAFALSAHSSTYFAGESPVSPFWFRDVDSEH
jgi:hypothetical protein